MAVASVVAAGAWAPPVLPNTSACCAGVAPPVPPSPSGIGALVASAEAPDTVRLPCRYGLGSSAAPFWRTSKCTCGPVQLPVQPTSPIFWPAFTYSFTATSRSERWA